MKLADVECLNKMAQEKACRYRIWSAGGSRTASLARRWRRERSLHDFEASLAKLRRAINTAR